MTYRLPARFSPPRRYRYPYRSRRGSGAEKAVGLAIGAVLVSGVGARTAVTVTHHHAAPAQHAAVTAAVPASGGETAFFTAVLADLGAPASQADIASLEAWLPHEQPWPPLAQWDPLDSTLPEPGSWAFNTFNGDEHVQSYPTAAEGAQATALTLENGSYPLIVASLRSGAGLCGNPSLAGEFLTWSGGGYAGVC